MKMTFSKVSLFLSLVGLGLSLSEEPVSGLKKLKYIPSAVKANEPLELWQETVVYQVYPRSFKDSDGDGTGDLQGIISKLDYIVDLGVKAVWISPIYESPMKDFGYDISNFTSIDPIFGTLDDFKELSQKFKEKGIKIIMDFVPNHSSDMHPWFIKSVKKEGKYDNYYVWKDPKGHDSNGNPIPSNNWKSVFGGSMWEWNDEREQFYLHAFVKEQPDLNFENREVWMEIFSATKFWLDMGVDGFRVDAVPHLFEDQRFMDEPPAPWNPPGANNTDEYHYYHHIYTSNQPKVLDFLAEMRQLLDVYAGDDGKVRCMMVEAAIATEVLGSYYGDHNRPIAHFPFNFNLLSIKPYHNAEDVKNIIEYWYDNMPEGKWASSLIGNHDNRRMPTRLTCEGIDTANIINHLIQGTSVSYNGEEIGMEDEWISWEDTVDPAGCNAGPERYEQTSRDPARTPMQWDTTKNAGFTSGDDTWLPMHNDSLTNNVELQTAAEESHLKVFKALVALRARNVWKYGDSHYFVSNENSVLIFTRTVPASVDDMSLLVLANFGDSTQTVDLSVIPDLGVPEEATVLIRSINFESRETTIGSNIKTNAIPLGPRNSIVLSFPSASE